MDFAETRAFCWPFSLVEIMLVCYAWALLAVLSALRSNSWNVVNAYSEQELEVGGEDSQDPHGHHLPSSHSTGVELQGDAEFLGRLILKQRRFSVVKLVLFAAPVVVFLVASCYHAVRPSLKKNRLLAEGPGPCGEAGNAVAQLDTEVLKSAILQSIDNGESQLCELQLTSSECAILGESELKSVYDARSMLTRALNFQKGLLRLINKGEKPSDKHLSDFKKAQGMGYSQKQDVLALGTIAECYVHKSMTVEVARAVASAKVVLSAGSALVDSLTNLQVAKLTHMAQILMGNLSQRRSELEKRTASQSELALAKASGKEARKFSELLRRANMVEAADALQQSAMAVYNLAIFLERFAGAYEGPRPRVMPPQEETLTRETQKGTVPPELPKKTQTSRSKRDHLLKVPNVEERELASAPSDRQAGPSQSRLPTASHHGATALFLESRKSSSLQSSNSVTSHTVEWEAPRTAHAIERGLDRGRPSGAAQSEAVSERTGRSPVSSEEEKLRSAVARSRSLGREQHARAKGVSWELPPRRSKSLNRGPDATVKMEQEPKKKLLSFLRRPRKSDSTSSSRKKKVDSKSSGGPQT